MATKVQKDMLAADLAPMVLIEEIDATAGSATVDFVTGLDSSFDEYRVMCINVTPAVDGRSLAMRVSEDAGSSWKTGGSDYQYSLVVGSPSNGVTHGGSTGSNFCYLHAGANQTNTTGTPMNGYVSVFTPHASGLIKVFKASLRGYATSGTYWSAEGICLSQASGNPVSGLRFMIAEGGNVLGKFRLYGIRK